MKLSRILVSLRGLASVLLVGSLLLGSKLTLQAGKYGSQSFSYTSNSVPGVGTWQDGTTLSSTTPGYVGTQPIASVQSGMLRLTKDGEYGTVTAFKIPDLDKSQDITAFSFSTGVRMNAVGTPGRGWSMNFGSIPQTDGDGELGYPLSKGLVVSFRTAVDSAAGETQGEIAVFVNRIKIASYPRIFNFDAVVRTALIKWDAQGLDITYNGVVVVDNLPVPGFVPQIGDSFAILARTGDATTQEVSIDNLVITTTPASYISTGGFIISEFVANNDKSLEDEDGDASDWVELYNGGTTNVMDGYFLTDTKTNLTQWPIPTLIFPTNKFRIIYASAKDRSATNGQLHANFKLKKEGGYLALVRPDLTIASEYEYGPQVKDVSYGEIGTARARGYLETPTPLLKNVSLFADGPPMEDVQFLAEGGLITGSPATLLGIAPPTTAGAVIRYTLNNSIPTEVSPVYAAPLSITNTTTVRARVFGAGRLPGPIASRLFARVDSTLVNYNGTGKPFSSGLPIVVFDTYGVDVESATDPGSTRPYRTAFSAVIDRDPVTGRASILGPVDFQGRSGIHVRGESSSGFGQKAFSWELWDENNVDESHPILGMPAESDWALHAPWSEKTLMRNHLIYSTMQEARSDHSSGRSVFVEVFLNPEPNQPVSFADYRGVYLLVEKIKQGKNRVNIPKPSPLATDTNVLTGGYVFKKDKASIGATRWASTYNTDPGWQANDPEVLSAPMLKYLQGYINQYETVLGGPNFANPTNGYAAYIDVSSFIDAQLWLEIAKQVDGYVFSTYFYKDRNGPIHAGPLWDFNIALGNADYATGDLPKGWLYNGTETDPLAGGIYYPRLLADPNYKMQTFDRFFELRRSIWGTQSILARIDGIAKTLMDGNTAIISNTTPKTVDNPVARHYRKYQILGTRQWPNPAEAETRFTYQSEVNAMKTWLTTRLTWMDDQYIVANKVYRPPVLNKYGGNVPAGFQVTLTPYSGVPSGALPYATGQIKYTLDGTDPRPSGYALPTSVDYVIIPEYSDAQYFVPTAVNGGPSVLFSDWTSPVLGGSASPLAWTTGRLGLGFDYANNVIDLGSPLYKQLGGTNNPPLGDISASMRGKASAVFIRVPFNIDATKVSQVADLLLKMRADDGFVAYLNGVEVARANVKSNTVAAWDTKADGIPSGWRDSVAATVKDYNIRPFIDKLRVGNNVLAILGVNSNALDDDALFSPRLSATLSIPPSTPVTAQTYTTPITISNTVTLKARLYANGAWGPLVSATFVPESVPASANNLVISEVMYHPQDPNANESTVSKNANDYEYLEFLNTSIDAVDMTSVRITNGVRFSFNDADPSTLRLLPGDRVVVCANKPAFQKRYGTSPDLKIAGAFLDNLKNSGEQITVIGATGQVLIDFAYSDQAPWPVDADGSGYSIVLNNPTSHPDPGIGANWRSSAQMNGKPGYDDSFAFTLSPSGDDDGDGLLNLLEFAIGTDPLSPTSNRVLQIGQKDFTVNGKTESYLVLEYHRNLGAGNVKISLQTSADMLQWNSNDPRLLYLGGTNNGDGTDTVTYRSVLPVSKLEGQALFVRLQVQ